MTRYGAQYGPDITFLGVPACDLDQPDTYAGADVVILGAPFDGGTSHRPGTRFGPQAIRMTDYLPHDGSRPSLALRTDGLADLRVVDAGDVEMYSGDIEVALPALEAAVERVTRAGAIPVVLGGDHSIAFPDAKGVANVLGHGRISMIHFDAHADTGDIEFGSLWGHGQPMRRLIESGALRGDRFLQVGLRGYWPPPETLDWMAGQRMRSFEMTEIVHRGLQECLTEAFAIATDECDGVFLSVDIDVCDPGHAPGTGTPEPGGLSARELLDSVRRICLELPVVGVDVVEVSPPYDHADITAALANRVVLESLSAIARRRRDEREGTRWDPAQPLLAGRVPEPTQPFGGAPHGHGHHHSTALSHDHSDTWPPRAGRRHTPTPPTPRRSPDGHLAAGPDRLRPDGLLIGGSWRDSSDGGTLKVEDPSTGEILTEVADATVADGKAALDAAVAAQADWAKVPPRDRGEILRSAFDKITERADDFAMLMTLEMGKTLAESRGEVTYGAEFFRWFAEEAVRVHGRYAVAPNGATRLVTMKAPVGPTLMITPWNFPLAMGTRKIGPAIAAGCTMVVKPAGQTPLSMLALAKLLQECGLPDGVLNVVTTSRTGDVMEPIIRDPRLRKLTFTGSTGVGRKLVEQSAEQLLRVSMELGGNAPFIVFEDADLDRAVEGAMLAKMRNIGGRAPRPTASTCTRASSRSSAGGSPRGCPR